MSPLSDGRVGQWAPPGDPGLPGTRAPRTLYLQPGHLFVASEPTVASTILGSCVSVCLFDPRHAWGGANHYLLPESLTGEASARFGDSAIEQLLQGVLKLGSRKADLQAKVFGGAAVVAAFQNRSRHLGDKNVDTARAVLRALGIPIVAEDVGGQRGRKLHFDTGTGVALVRLI